MDERIETLSDIADRHGWGFRRSYGGRAMYGATCPGITTGQYENPLAAVDEAAAAGIRGARMDSMGLGTIVYWPDITTTEGE